MKFAVPELGRPASEAETIERASMAPNCRDKGESTSMNSTALNMPPSRPAAMATQAKARSVVVHHRVLLAPANHLRRSGAWNVMGKGFLCGSFSRAPLLVDRSCHAKGPLATSTLPIRHRDLVR